MIELIISWLKKIFSDTTVNAQSTKAGNSNQIYNANRDIIINQPQDRQYKSIEEHTLKRDETNQSVACFERTEPQISTIKILDDLYDE